MNQNLPVLMIKKLIILPYQEVRIELNIELSKKIVDLSEESYESKLLVICPKDALDSSPSFKDLPDIGVLTKIKAKMELPNGNYRIILVGLNRVQVDGYKNHEVYTNVLLANIKKSEKISFDEKKSLALSRRIKKLVSKYIEINPHTSNSIASTINNISDLDMLVDKYDENNDLLKEIYKLTDQGDRKLGLRYDLTVPFAKFIALNKNNISFPFKRYEIAKVFRDGPVKVGRDREFTQCDADVVGISGELVEAELLSLYITAFKRLDIDIIIKYNNRNLMSGLISEVGIEENKISSVITIIDKMNKITEAELIKYLVDLGIEETKVNSLLAMFKMDLESIKSRFENSDNEVLKAGIMEIDELSNYIEKLGYNDKCILDLTLARGQDYYTGNVFEVYDKSCVVTSSIGGGGRYDNMIGEYINDGEKYPAVGISFGLTSIFEILKTRDEFNKNNSIEVFIIPMSVKIEALDLANKLRNMGINVEIEMKDRKLKRSLDFANRENIPYVIILGEDEINNKKFVLKDMFESNNIDISMDNLDVIKDYLK